MALLPIELAKFLIWFQSQPAAKLSTAKLYVK